MKDILCSKLYVSSSRKDRILAAIQDPNNRELVQQVASYLDDEFIDSRYLDPESSDDSVKEMNKDPKANGDSNDDRDSHSNGGMSHGGGFSSSGFSSMDDLFDDSDDSVEDVEQGSGDTDGGLDDAVNNDVDEPLSDPVVESSKSIKASLVLDVVKGTLNARQDTAGVDRVVEKENELWVYYNDNVNLNKVMSEAAQELILQGYSMLEFNRLARSNNAIVFDIVKKSSGGA